MKKRNKFPISLVLLIIVMILSAIIKNNYFTYISLFLLGIIFVLMNKKR